MKKIKKLFLHKDLSSLFSLITAILSTIGLIVYMISGVSEFVSEISLAVIISSIIAIVLSVFFTAFESKLGRFACYALLLFAFIEFIGNQINLIANVLTSIDGNSLPITFIICTVCYLISFVLSFISGIMTKDEIILIKGEYKK